MLMLIVTWLTNEVQDFFVSLPNYDLVRADSPSQVRKHGVAVYISSLISYNVVDCDIDNIVVVYLGKLDL